MMRLCGNCNAPHLLPSKELITTHTWLPEFAPIMFTQAHTSYDFTPISSFTLHFRVSLHIKPTSLPASKLGKIWNRFWGGCDYIENIRHHSNQIMIMGKWTVTWYWAYQPKTVRSLYCWLVSILLWLAIEQQQNLSEEANKIFMR